MSGKLLGERAAMGLAGAMDALARLVLFLACILLPIPLALVIHTGVWLWQRRPLERATI